MNIKNKDEDQLVMHVTSDGSLETVADSRMESIVISKGRNQKLTYAENKQVARRRSSALQSTKKITLLAEVSESGGDQKTSIQLLFASSFIFSSFSSFVWINYVR